jgi:Ser/Thr protein kinase RdoA (MazF antagonist)
MGVQKSDAVLTTLSGGEERTESTLTGTLFPVTYSVFLAEALGRELSSAYQLSEPVTCRLLRRGFHDTYLMTASGQRYIARVYRTRSHAPPILYELELLVHLSSRGVSVATPLADRHDRLAHPLESPEGIRYVVLFKYANGRGLSWSVDASRRAGGLLGAIHRASDDFTSANDRASLDAAHLIDASLTAVQPYLEYCPDAWTYLMKVAGTMRSAVAAREGELEWGPCHGDFNSGNIHIGENNALTAFDFDFCGPGWRALDFVGAWRWGAALDVGLWNAFLVGYRSIKQIGRVDLASVPLFDGVSRLWSLGLRAANATHRGRLPVTGRKLNRQLKLLQDWEAEYLSRW